MILSQRPVRTVPPAALPVALAEMKAHLRLDTADEDTLVDVYLQAAVDHLDGWTGVLGRCLVTQTWAQSWSGFPDGRNLRLPFPDVASAVLTYRDAAGVTQTVAGSGLHLIHDAEGAALMLAQGAVWPACSDRPDAVTATLVCGYGAAAEVPRALAVAALLLAGHWYENRESVVVGVSPAALPVAVEALIAPYRRVGF